MVPKKRVSKWVKKIDKLITWVIIWGAVASIFWISRTKKWKKLTTKIKVWTSNLFKKTFSWMWKVTIFIAKIFWKK